LFRHSLKGKTVVLRHTALGRIPPALYSTQLLAESGFPILVLEFGEASPSLPKPQSRFERVRLAGLRTPVGPLLALLHAFGWLTLTTIFKGRPELLVAHGLQEQALAYFYSFLFRVPFTVHVHEPYQREELSRLNRLLFWMEPATLRQAKLTVFPEADRRALLQAKYSLKNPSLLAFNCPRKRPTARPRAFRKELGLRGDDFILGYLGGIGELNALDLVIQTLPRLPKVHFLLAGWGDTIYLEGLRKLARTLRVGYRVHFYEPLDEDKWEWLSGLDAAYCVYRPLNTRAKHQATASNKLFEAMACGIPVVVGPGEDFTKLLAEGSFGVQLQALTPHALLKGISDLAENSALRVQMGIEGRSLHQNRFHYENAFAETLVHYKQLQRSFTT
jgi:glycosyltransferase involved in cell wall biosynthesis